MFVSLDRLGAVAWLDVAPAAAVVAAQPMVVAAAVAASPGDSEDTR
jgi:hypothetical protein